MAEIRTTSSTGGQKGVKLARFDLIPAGPLRELAEHYGRGARKYADHQWRKGYEWSKSIAALGRHFNEFLAGRDYDVCENDPDGCSFVDADGNPFEGEVTEHGHTCFNHTGSHHITAVAWHSFCLLEFKDNFPEHDDRYAQTEPDDTGTESIRALTGEEIRRVVIHHADVAQAGIPFGPSHYFLTDEQAEDIRNHAEIGVENLRGLGD